MRCTPPLRRSSSLRTCSWTLLLGLSLTTAAQQPPVGDVPTETHGPPQCTAGAKAPAASDALNRARQEQTDGLRDTHALPSAEPLENFGVARYKLAEYGECTGNGGCYWADLDAQYRRAEAALASQLATHKHRAKLAIVMDIDETSLTNYCEMRREEFGYIAPMYRAWEMSPEAATPIAGALRLFKEARAADVAVFFITGRAGTADRQTSAAPSLDETAATARNLESAGFRGWTGLQLRNGPELHMDTIEYKSSERRRIVEQGYTIVLSVGDQWSDLLGDPQAEVSVKLPNPFYFLP